MAHQILVIGEMEKEQLKTLKSTAEANPLMPRELMTGKPIGDNPNYALILKNCNPEFRIVFSIERQPFGFCRHLSVSVSRIESIPNAYILNMIAEELGFEKSVIEAVDIMVSKPESNSPKILLDGDPYAYPEKLDIANAFAINVLEVCTEYKPPLIPGVVPVEPPFQIHGDAAQGGQGGCLCPDCQGESENPLAKTAAKFYPTHTHGLLDIEWPEIFINALAYGAMNNSMIINELFVFLWINPDLKKEFDEKGELEIDRDAMAADDKGGSFMIRKVDPQFSAVTVAYTDEEIKDCKYGFMQIYVKGDVHVLDDAYYVNGGTA